MKKVACVILLAILAIQWSYAQKGDEATVHLTNGSVVKGRLTRLDNSDRFKVETPNGSVIHFTDRSVKEIVYEKDRRSKGSSSKSYNSSSGSASSGSKSNKTAVRYTSGWFPGRTPGYRGFAEIGYTFGTGDFSVGRFELSTSHGYQFNPYLFFGGGIGVNLYKKESMHWSVGGLIDGKAETSIRMFPIYADFRGNFTQEGPFIPFAGIKIGYAFGRVKYTESTSVPIVGESSTSVSVSESGFYLAPAIGVKYMVARSLALNLSLGYTAQYIDGENFGGITLKLGVEF